MAAAKYDIYIEQGATFFMTLTLKDENGDAIDLTGHTFRGKVKKLFTDVAAICNFSFNVLNQAIPANLGKVEVSLSATTTAAIPTTATKARTIEKLFYDIESQDVSGFVKRWLEGNANISPEITN